MIPRPGAGDIPESPEKAGQPVRGPEPLPLLFATIEDMDELKRVVKALGERVKELEARIQAIEGGK